MVRLFAIMAALLFAGAAQAADGAQSRAIGFSPDGKYFAFEQYGIQDGSGFAYSDIFVLDIAADTWLKGTPVRVSESEDGEGGAIDKIRDEAMAKAKPVIDAVKATGSVDTLVHMPFTELGVADRRKARFGRYYISTADLGAYEAMGSWEVSVGNISLPVPADCGDLDIAMPMGMEVTVKNMKSGAVTTAAKDTAIPKSRFCPHDYDIEAVFAPAAQGVPGDPVVALIGVYSRGFEGSDRRIIAVPLPLPE
jgi:predicted secreted protein